MTELPLPEMTGPQIEILEIDECADTFIDVEGSPRSAKSWGVAFWLWKLAFAYPGICIFYSRYKESTLSQLREVWGKVAAHFPDEFHPGWNAKDQTWDFPNGVWRGDVFTGSRVYLSGIKPSDTDGLHSKYKGKTLAVIVVEEAQELPYANYQGMKERLSQSRTPDGQPFAYPLKLVLVHNCVDEDHWIAKEFPLDGRGRCTKAHHRHIRADLYSNRQNLGDAVMAVFENNYPPGHPLRPTVIEGRRGLSLVGKPVYSGYFDRALHASDVRVNPAYPLLEGWDFGHEKPAVTWWQYVAHTGALQCVGAVRGNEMFIETFAPKVLEIRARWFPHQANILSWCDPAGATNNNGTIHTAVRTLQDLGVNARYEPKANDPDVRYAAIQVMAGFMERLARDGQPAFQVTNTRCIELFKQGGEVLEQPSDLLIKSFEVGYIWDEKALSDAHPNIRKPKKGTRYDDLMNAAEYVVTGEKIGVPQTAEMLRADQRLAMVTRKMAAKAYEDTVNRAAVGPTGETLMQAAERLARLNKAHRDHDPLDRKVASGRRRGGW